MTRTKTHSRCFQKLSPFDGYGLILLVVGFSVKRDNIALKNQKRELHSNKRCPSALAKRW